jgi:hypothetical protein
VVCFLYNSHKTEETSLSFSNDEKIKTHVMCKGPGGANSGTAHRIRQWM